MLIVGDTYAGIPYRKGDGIYVDCLDINANGSARIREFNGIVQQAVQDLPSSARAHQNSPSTLNKILPDQGRSLIFRLTLKLSDYASRIALLFILNTLQWDWYPAFLLPAAGSRYIYNR